MRKESIYTAAQWRWVAERYLDGYNPNEIATFLGVSRNTIVYHLTKAGVFRKLPPLEERKREFVELGKE